MTWVWWVLLGIAVWACFAFAKRVKTFSANQTALVAAVKAHVGREPDYSFSLKSHDRASRRTFMAFVHEHKFYLAEQASKFDPKNFFGPDDIRAWTVEWGSAIDDNDRAYRTRFSLRVEVKSIDTPLIKIDCQDEATAYRVREIFNQMFGERQLAQSV